MINLNRMLSIINKQSERYFTYLGAYYFGSKIITLLIATNNKVVLWIDNPYALLFGLFLFNLLNVLQDGY